MIPLGGDCNGIVMNGVRYDSPVYKGFSVSASWGADDFWEVAGRYAGEAAGFRVAVGIGYSENMAENTQPPLAPFPGFARKDSSYFQAGGYLQHLASGLFVHAAYGAEDNDDTVFLNGRVPLDGKHWYVKAGIRARIVPLGHTILWGEYAQYDDQLGPAALGAGATSSELAKFGGGIAQELDSAAMTIWLKYRHQEADVEAPDAANLEDLKALDLVSVGALINF